MTIGRERSEEFLNSNSMPNMKLNFTKVNKDQLIFIDDIGKEYCISTKINDCVNEQVQVFELDNLTRIDNLEKQLNNVLNELNTLISKNDCLMDNQRYLEEKLNEIEKRPLVAKFE